MEKAIYYTHISTVVLFVLLLLVKTVLLLINSRGKLTAFSNITRIPERIIAVLLLGTGIYLLSQLPEVNLFMVIKLVCVFAAIPLSVIGFRKGIRVLALVSFLLIVSAYGLAEVSKKKLATGGISQAAAMSGKEIYSAACAQCHGDDGKKAVLGAADLSASSMDLNTIIATIKNGKGIMVGYDDRLTEAQIRAVAEYTNTLKQLRD